MTGPAPDAGRQISTVRAARERVLALLAAPPPLLVCTDFDGTLAPIVAVPDEARILPVARTALRTLARVADARPGRLAVAVISGRTAPDVAGRVRVGGLRYYGSHGMEMGMLARGSAAERLVVGLAPGLERHVPAAEGLAAEVQARLGRPAWLLVESKGPSVGFHYRAARRPAEARAAILDALDTVERALGIVGFERLESRRIVEVRPAEGRGKGGTLTALIAETRPGAVLALGDDRTDAEMFEVVRALASAGGPHAVSGLAVGVHGASETPPEIPATADLLVEGPHAAARLLAALARALAQETAAA